MWVLGVEGGQSTSAESFGVRALQVSKFQTGLFAARDHPDAETRYYRGNLLDGSFTLLKAAIITRGSGWGSNLSLPGYNWGEVWRIVGRRGVCQ